MRFWPSKWEWIIIGLMLSAWPTGVVAGIVIHDAQSRPPKDAQTLSAFAARMPGPARLTHTTIDAVSYIVWEGEFTFWAGLGLASGPPAYLFDERGNLVDWTPDRGDYHRLDPFLDANGTPVSLDTAHEMTRKAVDAQ